MVLIQTLSISLLRSDCSLSGFTCDSFMKKSFICYVTVGNEGVRKKQKVCDCNEPRTTRSILTPLTTPGLIYIDAIAIPSTESTTTIKSNKYHLKRYIISVLEPSTKVFCLS